MNSLLFYQYAGGVLRVLASPLWQAAAILAVAAVLRLAALDLRPPHFDEGVNGWFADQMARTGLYRYDPTNYHGPLHFYAIFISQTLLGRDVGALRLPAAMASWLAVVVVLRMGVFLGPAARAAALGMALSPAAVYYGRYSIHESWLVLFLLVALRGVLGMWQFGRARDGGWLIVGLCGMMLTKETWILHAAALALAFPFLRLWERVVPSHPSLPFASQQWRAMEALRAAGLALLVLVAFYSGLFLDLGALQGFWQAFAAWARTGLEAGGHEKPAYDVLGPLNVYWLALMACYEPMALVGFAVCFFCLGRADARVRYLAIVGAGTLLSYSVIPYKTPWCVATILPPFYLLAAAGLQRLPRALAVAVVAGLLGWTAFLSVRLNFFRHSSDGEMYAYVQTYEGMREATAPLLEAARHDPRLYHHPAAIVLESYYPLPWVLGDFTRLSYYEPGGAPAGRPWVFWIGPREEAEGFEAEMREPYFRKVFDLRSGVRECVAYYRARDFAGILNGRSGFEKREPRDWHSP